MVALGFTPSGTRQSQINDIVVGLKAAPNPVWSKIDHLWVLAMDSDLGAYLDWKSAPLPAPPVNATPFGNPGFIPLNGIQPMAPGDFLDSNVSFSTGPNMTLNSGTMFFNTLDLPGGSFGGPLGSSTPGTGESFFLEYAGGNIACINQNGVVNCSFITQKGTRAFVRDDASNYSYYEEGVLISNHVAAASAFPTCSTYLGNLHRCSGVPDNGAYPCQSRLTVVGWGGPMTGPEIAQLTTVINAYLTAIGH